jgi:ADP-heptose:LPS heptosyltransferase
MRLCDANSTDVAGAEAAARASFLRMSPRKWRLVRACESIIGPLLQILPALRSTNGWNAQPASILVIEYWNLGDLAIAVPFLRNLRRNFPRARISLLIQTGLESFLDGQGIVDEFIPVRVPWAQHFNRWRKYNPFSRHWISLARKLLAVRARQFDWAFSGRMDVRDNLILWLSGARRRIGYGVGGGGRLLTDRVKPDLCRPHRADIWLHLLEAVGVLPDWQFDSFRLTDADATLAQSFLLSRGIPSDAFLIGVHPGARIATRRWGGERFAEIVGRILRENGTHVLWFSEPGRPCEAPSLERCHTVSLDFHSFLAVLTLCRFLVCNDSGPMHLANLLNVPVVAIFGPQRPEWFGPRGPHDRVVIRPEFWCRPCSDYCIFEQPYCLRTISVEEVWSAVEGVRQRTDTWTPQGIAFCSQTDRRPLFYGTSMNGDLAVFNLEAKE